MGRGKIHPRPNCMQRAACGPFRDLGIRSGGDFSSTHALWGVLDGAGALGTREVGRTRVWPVGTSRGLGFGKWGGDTLLHKLLRKFFRCRRLEFSQCRRGRIAKCGRASPGIFAVSSRAEWRCAVELHCVTFVCGCFVCILHGGKCSCL